MADVDPTPNFSQVMASFPTSAPTAWMSVAAQLNAEGAPLEDINRAKEQFGTQLTALASGFQSDVGQAAKGAAEYVNAGFTIGGAVANVAGLIEGASTESPAALVQTTVGVMVGVLVAAGAATAGVGAAITGVVAVLTEVLSKAGLFGTPPVGTEICPGVYVNPKPDWVVGCIGLYSPSGDGKPVSGAQYSTATGVATNPLWMRFPVKGRASQKIQHGPLAGADWFGVDAVLFNDVKRFIDAAFDYYKWIEWDDLHPTAQLGDFQKAYGTAWRINSERALNGQKPCTDAEVLYHTNLAWNNAHASLGAGDVYLKQANLPVWHITTPTPPAGSPPYIMSLISAMQEAGLTDNFGPDGQTLRINMGGRKTPPPVKVVALHFQALAAQPTTVHLKQVLTLRGPMMTAAAAAQGTPVNTTPQTTIRPVTALFGAPPLWKRALPFVPAVVGAVAFPFVGFLGPAVGATFSALWYELRKT